MIAAEFIIYIILLSICSVGLLGLSIFSYKSKKGELNKLVTLMTLAGFFYCAAELASFFIYYGPLNEFLDSSLFLSMGVFFSYWILFLGVYTENKKITSKKNKIMLFVFPAILLIGLIVNFKYPVLLKATSHHLLFDYGILTYLSYVYYALVLVIGEIILIREIRKADKASRKSFFILIFVPIIILLPSVLFNRMVSPYINSITIFFAMGIGLIFYTLYLTDTFNSKPFLRENFIENIDVGMAFFDPNDILVDFNDAFEEFTGLPRSFIGKNVVDSFKQLNSTDQIMNYYYNEGNETFFYEKRGIWIDFTCHKLYEDDVYMGKLFTYYNISNIKYEENKAFLAEKEAEAKTRKLNQANKDITTLVKEVHHRVKNNLQLIVSSVHLDRKFKTEPEQILESTVNRLSALTLMYDNSYVQKSYSYINLSNYTQNLTARLVRNSNHRDIEVIYDLDDQINLKIEILTPLSLILNEIISNAIKHGYKDFKGVKKLNITEQIAGPELAELIIVNNGSKLPEDFDINNPRTLGLIMVKELVNQINGEITQVDGEGVGFKITFPLD